MGGLTRRWGSSGTILEVGYHNVRSQQKQPVFVEYFFLHVQSTNSLNPHGQPVTGCGYPPCLTDERAEAERW